MTPKVDKASIDHGQAMLLEARKLWQETTEGKAMQELMHPGRSEQSAAMMPGIRELVEAGTKVLDLLAEMYLHQQ